MSTNVSNNLVETDRPSHPATASQRLHNGAFTLITRPVRRLANRLLSIPTSRLLYANVLTALIVAGWLLLDARFEASIDWWKFELTDGNAAAIRDMGDWWWLSARNKAVTTLTVFAAFSICLVLAGLWLGNTQNRSLRSWFATVSILAIWISVATNWQEIAWFGKQQRIRAALVEFDSVVNDLREHWPQSDGNLPGLGQFMAYPAHCPATLILLTLPEFERTDVSFSVVEGGDGVLRFELVGAERGDWIEWHPKNSTPDDFISGLAENYTERRYQKLDEHWYLVRYETP